MASQISTKAEVKALNPILTVTTILDKAKIIIAKASAKAAIVKGNAIGAARMAKIVIQTMCLDLVEGPHSSSTFLSNS